MNCTTERPGTEVFVQKMCKVSWQSCVHVLLTFCAQSGVHQLCPLISILLAPIHLLSTFLAHPFVGKCASGQVGKWQVACTRIPPFCAESVCNLVSTYSSLLTPLYSLLAFPSIQSLCHNLSSRPLQTLQRRVQTFMGGRCF